MKPALSTSIVLVAASLALAAPVFAQPTGGAGETTVASQPVPDTAREAPGIPGPDAVNPAPGMHGPYVGAGRHNFYDVDARIAAVSQRVQQLSPGQRRSAKAQLRQIKSEEATQRARHGDLRDWDRENLNDKLDKLVQQFPSLQADAGSAMTTPAQ